MVFSLLLTAVLGGQLPNLRIDTSFSALLHENDRFVLAYKQFKEQYGEDELIIVAIEGEDVFDQTYLQRLKAFHQAIVAQVPHIDEIKSLINSRVTRGENGLLVVEELLQKWPQTEVELAQLKKEATANAYYRNLVLSDDGKVSAVMIKPTLFSKVVQPYVYNDINFEMVAALLAVTHAHQADGFTIRMVGEPVFNVAYSHQLLIDLKIIVTLSFILISIVLYAFFRQIVVVLIPLFIVVMATISSLSVLSILGVTIKFTSQILPLLIAVIGLGSSVYLLFSFYSEFDRLSKSTRLTEAENKKAAICSMTHQAGSAFGIFLLFVFFSVFISSKISPVRDLGLSSVIVLLFIFVYSLVFLPAILSLLPMSLQKRPFLGYKERLNDCIFLLVVYSTKYARWIISIFSLLLVLSLVGVNKLEFSHDSLEWLAESNQLRKNTLLVNEQLNGIENIEVVIKTGVDNGLHEPTLLHSLAKANAELESINHGEVYVDKTSSVVDILTETHKALNENTDGGLPNERSEIAKELLLFERSGSFDLENYVDDRFSQTRISVKIPWVDVNHYFDFIDELDDIFRSEFGDAVILQITGMSALISRVAHSLSNNMVQIYYISMIVFTLVLLVFWRNIKIGLLSVVAIFLPTVMVFGGVGLINNPINSLTILAVPIILSFVTYNAAIFLESYTSNIYNSNNVVKIIQKSMAKHIEFYLVYSVLLIVVFSTFMVSGLNHIFYFGVLLLIAAVLSLIVNSLLIPALIVVFYAQSNCRLTKA